VYWICVKMFCVLFYCVLCRACVDVCIACCASLVFLFVVTYAKLGVVYVGVV